MGWVAGEPSHEGGSDAPAHHEEPNPVGQPHPLCHQLGRYLECRGTTSDTSAV